MLAISKMGLTNTRKLVIGVIFAWYGSGLGLNASALAKGFECETNNQALRAMTKAVVSFIRADGSKLKIDVKLADNDTTRAAGFQRVCASTIADKPILFLFPFESKPSFHMNNVVAPIDIAFIDKDGVIDSVQAMQVYTLVSKSKPLYSPTRRVIAALEAYPGFFSENRIDLSTEVSWQRAENTQSE